MEGGHIMEPTSSDAVGRTLVAARRRLDAQEAEWFTALAEFDYRGGWAMDGHLSCVSWLVHFCGMARPTAKDKLRVALQLARRPVLAQAHAAGELSYSKVRALTRIDDADQEADQALVAAARVSTSEDMEKLARHWKLLGDQERPVDELARYARRGLRRAGVWDGMATSELVLPVEDQERLLNILDSYIERCRFDARRAGEKDSAESRSADNGAAAGEGAVDKDSAESSPAVNDPLARLSHSQARADAVLELIEAGHAYLAANGQIDPERANIDVIVDYDTLVNGANRTAELAGGTPLRGEAARRLACDAGLTRIIVKGKSEILDVGRKTREWNRAPRRAIRYRHGNQCGFPTCGLRILEIHHCIP